MEPPSAPSRGATLEWLSQNWGASLARALEAMTGESPVLEWSPDPATSASTGGEPILWWEQEFDLVAEPSLWIGLAERTRTCIATMRSGNYFRQRGGCHRLTVCGG